MSQPKLVVIGGGTGSFTLLQALKKLTPNITALVSMADDGGSTGVLRDELGVLPPGDVRQCLVALSEAPDELRQLFSFRFGEGTFAGHSFGNIFLSAVEKMSDNFADGVRLASDLLRITGRVVPITLSNVRLLLESDNGTEFIQGQGAIDTQGFSAKYHKRRLRLEPRAVINPVAEAAIRGADCIVIAPGDVYTSLAPLLMVDGVDQALQQTKARLIYVCNLVVKPGHTDDMSVADHAREIERFIGSKRLNHVLYNTAQPSEDLRSKYEDVGELLVAYNEQELAKAHYKAIGWPLIRQQLAARNPHDKLSDKRSLIRHDAEQVAMLVRTLL